MCLVDESDGRVTMIAEGERTARKEHRCSECRRKIRVGERYLSERYVFDGDFHHHKTCAHCQVVRAWLQDECGGWLYGAIEEDIVEHVEHHPWPVKRLAAGMRRFWARRNGELMPVPAVPQTTHERMAA